MSDYTVVYFKGIDRGFSVPSILTEFSFFGLDLSVRWYGVLIAFGFLLAVLFGGRMAYKWKMNLDKMIDVLIYGTIFGILGARLYYVLFQWETYKGSLSSAFRIWEGGLAIYGGLIGGLIAAFVVCKVRKLNFYNLMDMAAMSFLIGQGIGRWGNFTNQEAFGTNTTMPWGMWSEKISRYIMLNQAEFEAKGLVVEAGSILDKAYVHPTFLYESIWCLVGFGLLFLICKKYRKFSGQIMLCYGIWYGIGRTIFEGMRTDSLYFMNTNIRVSQLLSAALVVGCSVVLAILLRKYIKHPKPIEGVDFFPAEEPKGKAKTADLVETETVVSEETDNTEEQPPQAEPAEDDTVRESDEADTEVDDGKDN